MTTKWKIRRYSKAWRYESPVWVATAPEVQLVQEKVWVNNFLPTDRYKYCDTFAEAIAWATRQARTVEVELPKVVERKRLKNKHIEDLIVQTFPSYTNLVNDWGDMEMNLRHEELKPLGEYLLALHYEKENK